MAATTIMKNESATLHYHPLAKIVHHEFHKAVKGTDFQAVLTAGLELVKKHKAQKWLSDDRKNNTIAKDDETWVFTSWLPQVVAAGWRFWAIVLPENVFGQLNMKRLSAAMKEKGVTVQFFTAPDEALKWLEAAK
ncbi:MAG: hypothetical protein ABSB49_03450 [Polyangia bacterium]|jgi:hypothetical protein